MCLIEIKEEIYFSKTSNDNMEKCNFSTVGHYFYTFTSGDRYFKILIKRKKTFSLIFYVKKIVKKQQHNKQKNPKPNCKIRKIKAMLHVLQYAKA